MGGTEWGVGWEEWGGGWGGGGGREGWGSQQSIYLVTVHFPQHSEIQRTTEDCSPS